MKLLILIIIVASGALCLGGGSPLAHAETAPPAPG